MYVLLIWEEHPEKLFFYLFKKGSEMALLAEAADGYFINGDNIPDDHPVFTLNEKLGEVYEDNVHIIPDIPKEKIANIELSNLYHCGFLL